MTYSAEVLADSPLGYWRLGETSGTTAADSSGNGHAGTIVGTPTLGVAGLLSGDSDKALGLTANAGNYVSIASASFLDSQPGITYEAWVNITSAPDSTNNDGIIARYGSVPRQAKLYRDGNSLLRFTVRIGGVDKTVVGSTTMSGTCHVVGTYDGSSVKVYLNGALDGSLSFTGTVDSTTIALELGRMGSNAQVFGGTLDEAAVYGYALSDTRVAAHYNAGVPAPSLSGTVSASLPVSTAALSGSYAEAGSVAASLPVPTVSGSGAYDGPIAGTLAASLPMPTASSTGTYDAPPTGSLAATLPHPPTAALAGSYAAPAPRPYPAAVLADSPLAYWRLGDPDFSSVAAVDSSGHGRDGTYSYDTFVAPETVRNVRGAINGDPDGSVLSGSGGIRFTREGGTWADLGAFTVEQWANPHAGSSNNALFQRLRGGTGTVYYGFSVSSGLAAFTVNIHEGSDAVLYGPDLMDGLWHHLVGTYDGTTAKFYVDNVLVASMATTQTADAAGSGADFTLGGGSLTGTDEAAVYGSALSSTRIAAHYAAAFGVTADLPLPTSTISGSYVPPPVSGTMDATLKLPVLNAAGDFEAGVLELELMLLAVDLAGTYRRPPVLTDTTNALNGRDRRGAATVEIDVPVAALPPGLSYGSRRDVARALPTPDLVNGRPT